MASQEAIEKQMNSESQEHDEQQEKFSQGLIRDVWYGQRSLAQTYWGWGILFNALLVGGVGVIVVAEIANSIGIPVLTYIFLALIQFPIGIWVMVGLWRSATNNPGFWAVVVKILIVIGVILIPIRLTGGF